MLQELELRWQEYYELVTMLLQWIRHHILVFEERKFPTSYEEIEVTRSRPTIWKNQCDTDQVADDQRVFCSFVIYVYHLQVLWRQFLKFKETELPAKEADKNRSKHIFKSFEVRFPSRTKISSHKNMKGWKANILNSYPTKPQHITNSLGSKYISVFVNDR